MREIKGLKFRETQFIKPEEVYQVSYDAEIQNKTDRELAIRIAPSREHKTLEDSFGKMSVTVLQIYEEDEFAERVVKEVELCSMCGDPVPRSHPMCEACYQWLREGQK